MSHQQLLDGAIIVAGLLATGAFGVLESVVEHWLQRRRAEERIKKAGCTWRR